MAQLANTLKTFQFKIDILDLPGQFFVQKLKYPEMEIENVEHGETNHLVNTPGLIKYTSLELEKIKLADLPENWAFQWFAQAQNVMNGGGLPAALFKRTLTIRQLGNDGITTIATHVCEGAWVHKITYNDRDRTASENSMETVSIKVDKFYQVL